jgi:hypothetical protein
MRFFSNSLLGLVGVCIGMGLAAGQANAQQASFTLPVQAHWGRVVLEPGDYKIRFPMAASTLRVIQVSGADRTWNFLIPVTSYDLKHSDKSKLRLVSVNGNYNVESLSDAVTDRTFSFWLPKRTESTKYQNQAANIAVNIKAPK